MKIRIRQIYFSDEQIPMLCKKFEPYNNSLFPENSHWYEYGVIRNSYEEKFHLSADFTGIFSWRFEQKTGILGKDFIKFIRDNPKYDVYFINPFPAEELTYPNIWLQGEKSHPGLIEIGNQIFRKLGKDIQLEKINLGPENIAYSNYWVGNASFWRKYMNFTLPIAKLIETDTEIRSKILSKAKYHYDAPYLPFFMERLFSTFLVLNANIQSKKFYYSNEKLNHKYAEYIISLGRQVLAVEENLLNSSDYKLGHAILRNPIVALPLAIHIFWNYLAKQFRCKITARSN